MKLLLSLVLMVAPSIQPQDAKVRAGHTHDILNVHFNAKATRLVSYSAGDGWMIQWDVNTGRVMWQTKTNAIQKGNEYYTLTSFAFSPSDDLIASGSGNGTVQLWDGQSGRLRWRADAHSENVTTVAFSPDGRLLASAGSSHGKDEIAILSTVDGRVLRKLEDNSCIAVALSFPEDAHTLRAGNAGGAVVEWDLITGKRSEVSRKLSCRRGYEDDWETFFSADLRASVVRTGKDEVTVRNAQTGSIIKRLKVEDYRVHARLSADGQKLLSSAYGGFVFFDLLKGTQQQINSSSRTGDTIDLSLDGTLFAEGGSWGNAAIWITDTRTGKTRRFDGRDEPLSPYQPNDLEVQLIKEKDANRKLLAEAKNRRDQQASIDVAQFKPQIYITFEHFGDMVDPGQLRLVESGEPDKSNTKKSPTKATAAWLRLRNASPLPVEIPTRSLYLPDPKCVYEYAGDKKLPGLCDGREISVWYGLEDKKGKALRYALDFGATSVLLPGTSVLFATPLSLLKNEQSISFAYSFLKETDEGKVDKYGGEITLKVRQTHLPASP
jgi:Anaphase-promoting complex subunit 4 WD40 domain